MSTTFFVITVQDHISTAYVLMRPFGRLNNAAERNFLSHSPTLVHILDSKVFIRIHRNSIINIHSVKTLSGPTQNEVLLKNSMKVIVSRRSRGSLIQLLKTQPRFSI